MKTPIMSDHAVQRCAEMGISTKVAKYTVRHADQTWPAYSGRLMAWCHRYPDVLALYVVYPNRIVIVTVMWRSYLPYLRLNEFKRADR